MGSFNNLKPLVRLSILNPSTGDHSEFGRGVASLCQGVQDKGSLNAAAKSMGMAYSKAWRIVKETETNLGFDLLDRDGAHGSALTPEGEKLLALYNKMNDEMQKQAQEVFNRLSE